MMRKITVSGIVRRLLSFSHGVFLRGQYRSWAEAVSQSRGYEDVGLIERVVQRNRAAVAGDEQILDDREIQLLSATLVASTRIARDTLHVVDVGGELGGHHRSLARFLNHTHALEWTVLETPLMAAKGNEIFKTAGLSFSDDRSILRGSNPRPDIILASGVLQCLEDPRATFDTFSRSGAPYILISVFPATLQTSDILTTRFIKTSAYEESYPLWLFSEISWKNVFREKYKILMEWKVDKSDRLPAIEVGYRGFLLERR